MSIMSGRADYGDATTVGLIDELADLLERAKDFDAAILRRLSSAQCAEYEGLISLNGSIRELRAYATAWQARLDAEVV